MDKIFKIEAQDDELFVRAIDFNAADDKVRKGLGLPDHFPLVVSEVRALPEGQEIAAL